MRAALGHPCRRLFFQVINPAAVAERTPLRTNKKQLDAVVLALVHLDPAEGAVLNVDESKDIVIPAGATHDVLFEVGDSEHQRPGRIAKPIMRAPNRVFRRTSGPLHDVTWPIGRNQRVVAKVELPTRLARPSTVWARQWRAVVEREKAHVLAPDVDHCSTRKVMKSGATHVALSSNDAQQWSNW